MTTQMPPLASSEIPPVERAEAARLALEAYERFAEVLAAVPPDGWDRPTDCTGWTVRHLAGHMVGAMRSAASMREMLSQLREIRARVRRDGGNDTDTMTQVQIDRTADLAPEQLVAECRALAQPAAAGRRRTPGPLRRLVRFPVDVDGVTETWRLGYLVDVILTRDAWLHRIDLCRALEVAPMLTAEHDGRIVADVVAEWARRHGEPFTLVLTGPAGGTFTSAGSPTGEPIEIDAVEFCRILSGRRAGTGLLATAVPF